MPPSRPSASPCSRSRRSWRRGRRGRTAGSGECPAESSANATPNAIRPSTTVAVGSRFAESPARSPGEQREPERECHRGPPWAPSRPSPGPAGNRGADACTTPYPMTHTARNAPVCQKLQPCSASRKTGRPTTNQTSRRRREDARRREHVDGAIVREHLAETWPRDPGCRASLASSRAPGPGRARRQPRAPAATRGTRSTSGAARRGRTRRPSARSSTR